MNTNKNPIGTTDRLLSSMEIASENGILPDFELICKYYPACNAERFYNHFNYYYNRKKDQPLQPSPIEKVRETVVDYSLQNFESDIIYFFIEAAQELSHSNWATEINLAKIHNNSSNDEWDLLRFLEKVANGYLLRPSNQEFDIIASIKFTVESSSNPRNKKHILITSHPVCYDISMNTFKALSARSEEIKEAVKIKRNLNPSQYERNFILRLRPFVLYLKNETIQWRSMNEIYRFVSSAIEQLPYKVNIDEHRIKDVFKTGK
jgi:hypothetical protein